MKTILLNNLDVKHVTDNKQYTVLEIQLRSVKYTVATRIRKNFEQFLIPMQMIQSDYSFLM